MADKEFNVRLTEIYALLCSHAVNELTVNNEGSMWSVERSVRTFKLVNILLSFKCSCGRSHAHLLLKEWKWESQAIKHGKPS